MDNKRKFLCQGLLMTGVSLLLRFVGVSTQIVIAGKIGAEGVGISALISGMGAFAITLALSGIQPGCIRLMSEYFGKGDITSAKKTLKCSIWHALLFGTLSGLLLFIGADLIGRLWIRDERAVTSLRILSLTLPCVSLSSCFGGYFISVRRVYKSACVQVIGEFLRVILTLSLLNRMIKYGLTSALIALSLGNAIADIFATCCLTILCLIDSRMHLKEHVSSACSPPDNSIIKRLLAITMPIAVAAYARSGLIAWEHSLIPRGLQAFGMNHTSALASYGQVQSMAMPVILFPCALLWSFAGLLVPEITEAHVRKERRRIQFMMQKVFSLTLVFAIGTSGIMIAFSEELGHILYQSSDVAHIIRILAPLIPVMYLDGATDAMLKGLGQQVYSMKVNIIDSLLSIALVWLLIPQTGIIGYVITIYITELVNAGMSIVRLLNLSEMNAHIISWIAKPVLCIIGATCIGRILYILLPVSLESIAVLVSLTAVVISLYIILLLAIGSVKKDDLYWLHSFITKPKSQKSHAE